MTPNELMDWSPAPQWLLRSQSEEVDGQVCVLYSAAREGSYREISSEPDETAGLAKHKQNLRTEDILKDITEKQSITHRRLPTAHNPPLQWVSSRRQRKVLQWNLQSKGDTGGKLTNYTVWPNKPAIKTKWNQNKQNRTIGGLYKTSWLFAPTGETAKFLVWWWQYLTN